jgi:hypothetical protein
MILVNLTGAIRDIVQADITKDIARRLFCYDVLRLASDDNGTLGFPIELNAGIGSLADWVARSGEREQRFWKDLGFGWRRDLKLLADRGPVQISTPPGSR